MFSSDMSMQKKENVVLHPDSYHSSISSGPSLHKAGLRGVRQKPRSVAGMSSNALFRLDLNMMYE